MSLIEIFVDGACSGNPGPGGYGIVIRQDGQEKTYSGGEVQTTNNRMELRAAIEALRLIPHGQLVEVYTDSVYVQKGITQWLANWVRRHWKNAQGDPVKNRDLWEALAYEVTHHRITWHWIKGHNGHRENELADALARKAILALFPDH